IIVVTADSSQHLASYASYGKNNVDIAASGSLQTKGLNGEVSTASGTSMAAPIVTRTAAVIIGLYPELTYQEVRDCIFSTVDSLDAPEGKGIKYGVLDHDAAVACAASKGIDLGIEQFQLIEEPLGNVHQVIQNGDTLKVDSLPSQMNIRVETPNTVGSLQMSLQGPQSVSLVRSGDPYTLFDSPVASLEEGIYTLEAQRYAGTKAKGRKGESKEVSFSVIDQTITGLGNGILQHQVQIFPNPTTDELVVNWSQVGRNATVLSLYNSQGRVIKQYSAEMGEQQITLNLGSLPEGVYLLKLQMEGQIVTRKILRK
ncbi:MAG: S8/S53 family peptidase, partial [Bacteroidota bacterium]